MNLRFNASVKQITYILFFLSGLTSLIYEVIWVRLLTLTFGAAAFAIATVLLSYMGGLCAGSFWFGNKSDGRYNNLKLYGILELLIGLYALVLPFILDAIGDFYIYIYQSFEPSFYSMSIIRLFCSSLVLGIPTFMMGGTLPLLTASLTSKHEKSSRQVANLYALNTLGAASGCLLSGYLLIPNLGLSGTTILASVCNILICFAALFYNNKRLVEDSEPESAKWVNKVTQNKGETQTESQIPGLTRNTALSCLALSGLCAMAYQTLWSRLLSMIIGTTVYAFTIILATFLLGLVLGGAIYRGWFTRRPLTAFALSQLGVGLFVLATMPYFDELPFIFLQIFEASSNNWYLYQAARMGLAFSVLIVPTTCFGISFPLVVEICRGTRENTGKNVGRIYAVNTLGAIIGSFVGGFILIPFLGIQISMMLLALVNIIAGLALIMIHPNLAIRPKAILSSFGVLAAVLCTVLLRPWNLHYLNSAPYIYAHDYSHADSVDNLKKVLDSYELMFFKEDATATVSVLDIMGTRSLAIDGKTDASTGENADMSTQMLLTHLPALLSHKNEEALLVGLGSGVSLGSLLKHDVKKVDVLEISEAVAEASHFFNDYNNQALEDARVNLVIGDGRHHLARTSKTYNLIVSQPSNPWISGVSNLFTTEYYQLMHKRLSTDGIVCQWIPSYHMSQEMLAVILKSFTNVFPYATLWTSSVPGDLFAIGSKSPIQIDFPTLKTKLHNSKINQDLAKIQMNDSMLLAKTFKYSQEQINKFVEKHAKNLEENTDLNPIVEFMTPKFLLNQRTAANLRYHEQLNGDLPSLLEHVHFELDTNRRWFSESARKILHQ